MDASDPVRGPSAAVPGAANYRPALIQYFRRKTRDQSEIEDLVQDVFLRIAARRSGDAVENVAAYVFQTAASVLADRHRRRTVRHAEDHVEFDTERHGSVDFDAMRILEARQSLRDAVAALQSLPERTRTIFVLRRLEGHAYRDIADQFGISVSAVEKHMVRAVQHLASRS
jgi:RNA polymerase sigma-70 factor (ECF subfamily)